MKLQKIHSFTLGLMLSAGILAESFAMERRRQMAVNKFKAPVTIEDIITLSSNPELVSQTVEVVTNKNQLTVSEFIEARKDNPNEGLKSLVVKVKTEKKKKEFLEKNTNLSQEQEKSLIFIYELSYDSNISGIDNYISENTLATLKNLKEQGIEENLPNILLQQAHYEKEKDFLNKDERENKVKGIKETEKGDTFFEFSNDSSSLEESRGKSTGVNLINLTSSVLLEDVEGETSSVDTLGEMQGTGSTQSSITPPSKDSSHEQVTELKQIVVVTNTVQEEKIETTPLNITGLKTNLIENKIHNSSITTPLNQTNNSPPNNQTIDSNNITVNSNMDGNKINTEVKLEGKKININEKIDKNNEKKEEINRYETDIYGGYTPIRWVVPFMGELLGNLGLDIKNSLIMNKVLYEYFTSERSQEIVDKIIKLSLSKLWNSETTMVQDTNLLIDNIRKDFEGFIDEKIDKNDLTEEERRVINLDALAQDWQKKLFEEVQFEKTFGKDFDYSKFLKETVGFSSPDERQIKAAEQMRKAGISKEEFSKDLVEATVSLMDQNSLIHTASPDRWTITAMAELLVLEKNPTIDQLKGAIAFVKGGCKKLEMAYIKLWGAETDNNNREAYVRLAAAGWPSDNVENGLKGFGFCKKAGIHKPTEKEIISAGLCLKANIDTDNHLKSIIKATGYLFDTMHIQEPTKYQILSVRVCQNAKISEPTEEDIENAGWCLKVGIDTPETKDIKNAGLCLKKNIQKNELNKNHIEGLRLWQRTNSSSEVTKKDIENAVLCIAAGFNTITSQEEATWAIAGADYLVNTMNNEASSLTQDKIRGAGLCLKVGIAQPKEDEIRNAGLCMGAKIPYQDLNQEDIRNAGLCYDAKIQNPEKEDIRNAGLCYDAKIQNPKNEDIRNAGLCFGAKIENPTQEQITWAGLCVKKGINEKKLDNNLINGIGLCNTAELDPSQETIEHAGLCMKAGFTTDDKETAEHALKAVALLLKTCPNNKVLKNTILSVIACFKGGIESPEENDIKGAGVYVGMGNISPKKEEIESASLCLKLGIQRPDENQLKAAQWLAKNNPTKAQIEHAGLCIQAGIAQPKESEIEAIGVCITCNITTPTQWNIKAAEYIKEQNISLDNQSLIKIWGISSLLKEREGTNKTYDFINNNAHIQTGIFYKEKTLMDFVAQIFWEKNNGLMPSGVAKAVNITDEHATFEYNHQYALASVTGEFHRPQGVKFYLENGQEDHKNGTRFKVKIKDGNYKWDDAIVFSGMENDNGCATFKEVKKLETNK